MKKDRLVEKLSLAEKANFLSAGGTLASTVLTVVPEAPELRVASRAFSIYCRLRIGAEPLNSNVAKCACECASFAEDPTHSLNCNKLKGRSITQRHDSAVQAYAAWVRRAGGSCTVEKRVGEWPSQKRYDTLTVMGTYSVATDFVVTKPRPSRSPGRRSKACSGRQAARLRRRRKARWSLFRSHGF